MQKILYQYIDLPIARILLTSDGTLLTGLYFIGQQHQPIMDNKYSQQPLAIFSKTYKELIDYLNGKLKRFTIPYHLTGTAFQEKTCELLTNIPYEKVINYKEVANLIGYPNSVRAAANAIVRNNLLIIVPCHRVIGSNSRTGGYAAGTEMKQKLLALENYNLT